jgi:DNA primase large subunit
MASYPDSTNIHQFFGLNLYAYYLLIRGLFILVIYIYSPVGTLYIKLGTGDLAKYPFLNEASEYIRETHFEIDEFNRPEMKYILDRAVEKIEAEIIHGMTFEKLDKYEIEILTFLVTLMIIKFIGIESILKKHSLFEAMRAEKFLKDDLKKEKDEQKRRLLLFKIFEELFKLNVDIDPKDNRLFKVRVADYLMRASHFHEQEWKLINRLVHEGYVYLDADETVRLIRTELSSLIYDRIKSMAIPTSTIPAAIKVKVQELRDKVTPNYAYRMHNEVKDYPPCIKHALELMDKSENLPHSARLMLATYMLAIGKSVDDIVVLFHNAPDYNEKITRYQIEHLAGFRGSHTKYSVPSCEKLRIENLCFATKDCNGILNPIQFGRNLNLKKNYYV